MQERTKKARENLILSGMELYAKYGIEGVSLRAVNEHAGSANNSAAHYHFKSKENFISKILEYMFQIDGKDLSNFLSSYTQEHSGVELSVFRFVSPILYIYEKQPWGRSAIKFLANLLISDEFLSWDVWDSEMEKMASKFIEIVSGQIPGAEEKALRLRSTYMYVNFIFGLASEDAMRNTVFGDLSNVPEMTQLSSLIAYCAGGLRSAAHVKG